MKQAALAAGLAVTQPEKIRNNAEFRAQLEAIAPDAIVVVAYGRIIPPWMLALPRLGCINLHGSLLPKYRGAAPIQWAVAMGDAFTGNTTMLLEEGLDTGPILLQQTDRDRARADRRGAVSTCWPAPARRWWSRRWPAWRTERIQPQPQNHEGATFAPLLDREDGRMDFAARTATELYNRWRGFQPWPGAFTALDGKKLIVHRMAVAQRELRCAAGLRRAGPDSRRKPSPACCLRRRIPGSNSLKCSSKARSGLRPLSFCAELRSRRTRGWVERRVRASLPRAKPPSRILLAVERGQCALRRSAARQSCQRARRAGPQPGHGAGAGRSALADSAGPAIAGACSSAPDAKLDPEVLIALRLGAFQLLHLDRIPAHAAIDESVELAKQAGHRFASGMVNAVLRKLSAALARVDLSERVCGGTWRWPRRIRRGWSSAGLISTGSEAARAICRHGQSQPALTVRLAEPRRRSRTRSRPESCSSPANCSPPRALSFPAT